MLQSARSPSAQSQSVLYCSGLCSRAEENLILLEETPDQFSCLWFYLHPFVQVPELLEDSIVSVKLLLSFSYC